jgi:hypothetical protein
MISIHDLLYKGLLWNKEQVVVVMREDETIVGEMDRLEFQTEAVDWGLIVTFMEPLYDEEKKKPYLKLHCEERPKEA